MNSHIVKDGTYIPVTLDSFPEIPDTPLLEPKIVHNFDIENNYPFLDKSFKARFLNFAEYAGIFLIVFPLQRIRYGLKIIGKEKLRKNRKLFKNGAMTVSNHVYRWDYLAVLQAVKFRRMWFPARAAQVQSTDSAMIRAAGGIPIPETMAGLRRFYAAFDELHKKHKWIHVFPESCRWDFYQPIRPFKTGTFKLALKYDLPVIPMAFSFREPGPLRKFFGVKHPLITLTIGEPVLADKGTGKSRTQISLEMLKNAHKQIEEMAGIEKNMWPESL